MAVTLQERFRGCLLGLAVGDALGARCEGQSADYIRRRAATVEQLVESAADELWYTDDTQMAIGIAETLAAHGEILEDRLCQAFVANYVPSRGYGRGARVVLEAMEQGRDYRAVAANHFPGGSFGNGAAVRVAPVGLVFRHDPHSVVEQARLSAEPTHVHALGIEGAQLVALAVAHVARNEYFDRDAYFAELTTHCRSPEYRAKLDLAARVRSPQDLVPLGNGIAALESAPTAIASFALRPDSYEETIRHAILLGGDTDTIAAMAGAISGAHLGVPAIPARLMDRLEDSPKGRSYLLELADRLLAADQERVDNGN